MTQKTDEELMMAYKATGDTAAFEELYQRYKKPLLNYSIRILRNLADAEDVVGSTFCALTRRETQYAPAAKFKTWLYTIAHNICVDLIRKNARIVFLWFKKEAEGSTYQEMDIADTRPSADISAQAQDAAFLLKQAVHALPFEYREAIILREYQGMSYEEIAQVMRCSLAKVKVLIFRGREKLRTALLPLAEELQ